MLYLSKHTVLPFSLLYPVHCVCLWRWSFKDSKFSFSPWGGLHNSILLPCLPMLLYHCVLSVWHLISLLIGWDHFIHSSLRLWTGRPGNLPNPPQLPSTPNPMSFSFPTLQAELLLLKVEHTPQGVLVGISVVVLYGKPMLSFTVEFSCERS